MKEEEEPSLLDWFDHLPPPVGSGFLLFTPMSLPTDLSVFNILVLFRSCWFLLRDWLVSFIASAQQTDSSPIDWVEFTPAGHSHLVHCALKLAPSIPIAKV